MIRIYVSGPMSGLPDLNFPAFHAAALALRGMGFEVANPAEHEAPGLTWTQYLRRDIVLLMDCDAVALLPGYMDSKGAMLELTIAQALGMEIHPLQRWLDRQGAAA